MPLTSWVLLRAAGRAVAVGVISKATIQAMGETRSRVSSELPCTPVYPHGAGQTESIINTVDEQRVTWLHPGHMAWGASGGQGFL